MGDCLSAERSCSRVEQTSPSCQVLITGIKSFCEHVLEVSTSLISSVSLNRLVCDDSGEPWKSFWRERQGRASPWRAYLLEARGFSVAVRGAAPCAARGGPMNVGLFVEILPSRLGRVSKTSSFLLLGEHSKHTV